MARWSADKKNVWHTTQSGKVVLDSVKSFAKEDYFYRVTPLTSPQMAWVNGFSARCSPEMQKQHRVILSDLAGIQHLYEQDRQRGEPCDEVEKSFTALTCNMMEDYHTSHELDARPIIDQLVSGDFSVLRTKQNLINFCQFFGHQIARTKAFKDKFLLGKAAENSNPNASYWYNEVEGCWWLMSFLYGMNIGWSLYSGRDSDRHCLLINNTALPFITSDQPIVNAHQDLSEDLTPPPDEYCDFFFPLAPNAAFMINKSARFDKEVNHVSEDVVHEMNLKIATASSLHIVGNRKDIVQNYKKHVGRRNEAVRELLFQNSAN
jgi:hypothetical protein